MNTPTNRRLAMGRIAGVGLAVGAHAALGSEGSDPHLAWEREAMRLFGEVNAACAADDETRAEALNDTRWELLTKIAETPATTLAGLAVQLRYVVNYGEVERLTVDEEPLLVVSGVAAALDRLAIRGALS